MLKIGFPLCPVHSIASNPRWCQPLKTWKKYSSNRINEPTPDAILRSLMFFDSGPLYGNLSRFEGLRDSAKSMIDNEGTSSVRRVSCVVLP